MYATYETSMIEIQVGFENNKIDAHFVVSYIRARQVKLTKEAGISWLS